ncbi:MAG: DUF2075 domain-containing protein [Chromatiales bacterium]
MLLRIQDFKDQVQYGLDGLIAELQFLTGRFGEEEEKAWRESLSRLAKAFSARSFDPLHLYFGGRGSLALEYQLPASSSWCDVVLLGRHAADPSALIIELKNWQTRTDRPGPVEGLMERQGANVLHPSDQVRGYTEYCRRFHSAVEHHGAQVHGCVLFTKDYFVNSYRQAPNDRLADEYPCFTLSPDDANVVFPGYVAKRLSAPDEAFATAFEKGVYRQDRGFVSQIGEQILDPSKSPFELLDNQRRAFALCKANIEFALFGEGAQPVKKVIIVHGPPGSGKSVVAGKLWASLVTNENLPQGDVVFSTTSVSQNSNWSHLFSQAAHNKAGGGVVKKATGYTPISTQRLGQLRKQHGAQFLADAKNWRDHLRLLKASGEPFKDGARDDQYLISVVDEAHALINPEHPEGRGQFGFVGNLGPQAYHIIRSSTITVFLLDAEQSFRDRENTTVDDIRQFASELGATLLEPISLEGAQFRCAGAKEYVDWLESLLAGRPAEENRRIAQSWLTKPPKDESTHPEHVPYAKVAEASSGYAVTKAGLDFRILDTPVALEDTLRERIGEGRTARILASYARQWKTRDAAHPHDLPGEWMDFHEPYLVGGEQRYWSRPWNYVPRGSDYTHYVQAVAGSHMHSDPLSEVGCPYAVRGFDFDYVGILWLGDLKWRDGRWVVETDTVFETGIPNTLRRAKAEKDPDGPAHKALLRAVAQSYRILLTRALKGVYLWFEDDKTRRFVQQSLR